MDVTKIVETTNEFLGARHGAPGRSMGATPLGTSLDGENLNGKS